MATNTKVSCCPKDTAHGIKKDNLASLSWCVHPCLVKKPTTPEIKERESKGFERYRHVQVTCCVQGSKESINDRSYILLLDEGL